MRLYADEALTTPLDVIHLGTVEVGTRKEYVVYVVNPTRAVYENIRLTMNPEPDGLGIGNIPSRMEPGEITSIRIVWSPPLTLREALTVKLGVYGQEIYYA